MFPAKFHNKANISTSCKSKLCCFGVYFKFKTSYFCHFYLTHCKRCGWKQLDVFTLFIWQGPLFLLCLCDADDGGSRAWFDNHHFLYGWTAIPFQCALRGWKSCSMSSAHYSQQCLSVLSLATCKSCFVFGFCNHFSVIGWQQIWGLNWERVE